MLRCLPISCTSYGAKEFVPRAPVLFPVEEMVCLAERAFPPGRVVSGKAFYRRVRCTQPNRFIGLIKARPVLGPAVSDAQQAR
jgi:hypothetical protein